MSSALAGVSLDPSSPVPPFYQAVCVLDEAIEDGRLPWRSKLESELLLPEQLGTSRPTMREAIKQLADKCLLIRRRGIGTIVAPKPAGRVVTLTLACTTTSKRRAGNREGEHEGAHTPDVDGGSSGREAACRGGPYAELPLLQLPAAQARPGRPA